MTFDVRGTQVELKFTFNSFKYLEDFDVTVMSEIQFKPFKLLSVAEMLLRGALNHDHKFHVSDSEVAEILENASNDGTIGELITELMNKLQDSDFFKSLQRAELV